MRRFASSALASAILLLGGGTSAKADWDFWALKRPTEDGLRYNDLYGVNSRTKEATLLKRFCENDACLTATGIPFWSQEQKLTDYGTHIDKDNIILRLKDSASGDFKHYKYTVDANNNLTRGAEVTGDALWWQDEDLGGTGFETYRIGENAEATESHNMSLISGITKIDAIAKAI